jgi:phospholipase C
MRTLVASLLALACLPAIAQQTPPSCTFHAGALPADTLPAGTRHGTQIPIDTIVVIMQENRSFDHYFGRLHSEGKKRSEAEPKNASNPDPLGGAPISAFHQTEYCEVHAGHLLDLDHSWSGTHRESNNGAMDGFTAANADPSDASGSRTMGFYDRNDLPFYYALYRRFATADRYFCSVLGPTFPNRFYLLAGTSFGHTRNDVPSVGTEFAQRSIFNTLDEAGVSWRIYSDLSFAMLFAYVRNQPPGKIVPAAQFATDARAGALPHVVFVDPLFFGTPNVESDEHPPSNIQVGQKFVAGIVQALFASPQWPRSALFLMYDEHGGYYDHVPPPPACKPDDVSPMLDPNDVPGEFDRYGIRVPFVLVSPFAKRKFVSHRVYDHTSVLRFIETRFDLPALTARDANADPMLDLFSFRRPRFRRPPKLKTPTIDSAKAQACMVGSASGAFVGQVDAAPDLLRAASIRPSISP